MTPHDPAADFADLDNIGIDLTGMDPMHALRLGAWTYRQLRLAESAGATTARDELLRALCSQPTALVLASHEHEQGNTCSCGTACLGYRAYAAHQLEVLADHLRRQMAVEE